MTVITGTSFRAYELARHFRSKGIPVILGGPHVTLVPGDAESHADAIVVGYAEDTWPQLLEDFQQGKLKRRYEQGSSLSLANRPFPKRELMKRSHYVTTHVFEATRGCIHNCEFCVVPAAWGRKPFQKPVPEIIADIHQHWARKIIFIDLNLIADVAYAMELFEALITLKVKWFGLSTALIAKDDRLLELAARSGCTGLLIGFESMDSANLMGMQKGFNTLLEPKEVVGKLHRHGITVMGCFTFGLDHDTPDVFLKTARYVVESKMDLPRFAIVTPFPGTALYQRLEREGRILTRNWELYDAQHVVFQPAQMTVEQLQKGHAEAWKYVYRAASIFKRVMGSGIQLPLSLAANFGYRFYAYHLDDFYNCDWVIGQHWEQRTRFAAV